MIDSVCVGKNQFLGRSNVTNRAILGLCGVATSPRDVSPVVASREMLMIGFRTCIRSYPAPHLHPLLDLLPTSRGICTIGCAN